MYKEQFTEAIWRTKCLGLECPDIEFENAHLLDSFLLSNMIPQMFKKSLDIDQKVLNCMAIHMELQTVFNMMGINAFFTLGNVKRDNETYIFKPKNDADLLELLKNKPQITSIAFHSWLTLPSMEIVDFSLLPTLSHIEGNKSLMKPIALHSDRLQDFTDVKGLVYEPMLIGSDFLIKIGGVWVNKIAVP